MLRDDKLRRSETMIVTDACDGTCRYCYMKNKGPGVMSLETAKAAVDCLLLDPRALEGVFGFSQDFIGGEPLLQAELIEAIVVYTMRKLYDLNHPWFDEYNASISTNGLRYLRPEVQKLTRHKNLEIQITIDGPEDVHDSQRGAGTYAQIMRAFPVWRRRYPLLGTKVTLAPATLPHLARSIMHLLVDLELPQVHANPVFEGVWKPADAVVYGEQLLRLAEAMSKAGLPYDRCSLFDRSVGHKPMNETNWCGCGRFMLAVGTDGTFYPCVRFAPSTLGREPVPCGSVRTGIDWSALEVFSQLTRKAKSPGRCFDCSIAGGCAWCTGFDYDESGSLFHRATHICELHQVRARVNRRIYG